MDTTIHLLGLMAALLATCFCLPTVSQSSATQNKVHQNKSSVQAENAAILPENAHKFETPDMNHFEEIVEEDIPEGSLVLLVEEPLQTHADGELMDTSHNIVFRPLFRYRERETQRLANRRTRRRYYVPRRSYRDSYGYNSYYRPYRSISRRTYSTRPRPNRLHYAHYPVLA